MIKNTLMIFGPGGVGKSPLDDIIRNDAFPINPYRLRERPRDRSENSGSPDLFYGHSNLKGELTKAFVNLGDYLIKLSPKVEWFPKARTAFFDVRGEWQCLLLGGIESSFAKAEIFAPALSVLFCQPEIQSLFGQCRIVILNPVQSLRELNGDFTTLNEATGENCRKAGRLEKDVEKRQKSIDDPESGEAAAWLELLELETAVEISNWEFPEYVYSGNRNRKLIQARERLIAASSELESFFKTEDEIIRLA